MEWGLYEIIMPSEVGSMPVLKRPLDPDTLRLAGFEDLGDWTLQNGELLSMKDAPVGSGVYAFVIDARVVYVGVAIGGLRRRLRCYARPGNRKTATRINGEICAALEQGQDVRVLAAIPPAMMWNGLPINGAAGLELGLIQAYDLP